MDILNDGSVLRCLVDAHGGQWTTIEPLYSKATAQFRQPTQSPTRRTIADQISTYFQGIDDDGEFTSGDARRIKELIASKSRWAALKLYGEVAFRNEKSSARSLLDQLDSIGIVTVRVGELENFLTTDNARKGSDWLEKALGAGAHESADANDHATRLLASVGHQMTDLTDLTDLSSEGDDT